MEELLVGWDDLSNDDRGTHIDDVYTQDVGYTFNAASKLIQKKLIKQNRLILNPVENWEKQENSRFYESIATAQEKGGTYKNDSLPVIIDLLTTHPKPKERMVPVSWENHYPDTETIDLCNPIGSSHNYNVPISVYKSIDPFVKDWNKAREEGKLKGYEI